MRLEQDFDIAGGDGNDYRWYTKNLTYLIITSKK